MSSSLKQKLSQVWQFLKLALISGLVFFLVVVIAISVLAWVYRDNIKDAFIRELNNNLTTEATIGEVGVNFFRSFPMVSVTLSDVIVLEAAPKAEKDTLLTARRVYFQFNVLDIIKKQYKIKELEVALADFNPVVFKDGSPNYVVWKTQDESSDEDLDLVFDFERIILRRVRVNYIDYFTKLNVSFLTHNAELKGMFRNQEYNLKIVGKLFTEVIKFEEIEYVGHQDTDIDVVMDVYENKLFVFRQGGIVINKHEFDLLGEVDFRGPFTFLELAIESDRLKLQNLMPDLPDFVKSYFESYKVKGDFYFKTKISGTFSNVVNPFVSAEFGVSNAELSHRKENVQMKNLSFSGMFNNGRFRNLSSSVMAIKDISTQLNNGFLEGDFYLFNFNLPDIELSINSKIDLSDLIHFMKVEQITNPKGQLNLELSFKGSISDGKQFRPYDFVTSTSRGKLSFNDVSFNLDADKKSYNNFSGFFTFNNNDLIVESFSGNVSKSDFHIKGYFRNFLSYLFFDNEKLFVDADFNSKHLNFNELLQFETSGKQESYKLSFSDRLDFRLGANIDNIVFHDFNADKVKGSFYMRNKVFMAENVSLNTMGGKIQLAGTIDGKNSEVLRVHCVANSDQVEIQQLFFQLNNFNQEAIIDKHIKGKLNASVHFSADWSPYLDVNLKSIEANADIKIENGELIDYKPILQLSRFIKIGDLEHINFSTLENQISIKNETVFIPFMEINSSAINIKLSGEHHFNNDINYRLQVLLSDIFARRNRQSRNPQEKYGDIIDDGNNTTLFILVTGNIDDPIFKYDRKSVREKIRKDIKEERKSIIEILKKEFRLSRDTILEELPVEEKEIIKERKEIKKREEGDFIIEWD
jgi:hypothetical protein